MSESAADRVDPAEDGEPSSAPWHHLRPVWELELLISGAVVFSLFQIPNAISSVYLQVEQHLSSRLFLLPFILYYVVTLVVIALMIAFTAHFFLRGFWVALCGLNAVFPEGILWDRYDAGPIQKRVLQRTLLAPRELEQRVDRLASSVFSMLFLLLLSLLFALVWVMAIAFVATLLARFVPAVHPGVAFYVLLLGFLLPMMIAGAIDRRFKSRPELMAEHPRQARFVEATIRGYQTAVLGRLYNSIQAVFSTHFSTKRATYGSMIAMIALALLFLAYFMIRVGLFGYDSYLYFPSRPSPQLLRAQHYENLRSDELDRVATIQGDIIESPYVRLFVPYHPNRDRELIAEECPEVEPLRAEGLFLAPRRRGTAEQVAAVSECLRRIYEVRLNGEPLELPELEFHRRPEDGVVGVLAYLPTADMPIGRNVLEVARPKGAETEGSSANGDDDREDRREYLPFWR